MEDWWKHKLFQPKSIEGKPVTEQLDYIRQLFELASKEDPRLKGITIIGSTLKGYMKSKGKKVSDIDIATICDNSPKILPYGYITHDFLAKFYNANAELQKTREKNKLSNFKIEEVIRVDINYLTPEKIRMIDDLQSVWTMEGLVFPGVGDLETYRKIVRDEVNKYSNKEKETWLRTLINSITRHMDSRKSLKRGMVKEDEEEDFLQAREKLVDARVRRIFG